MDEDIRALLTDLVMDIENKSKEILPAMLVSIG